MKLIIQGSKSEGGREPKKPTKVSLSFLERYVPVTEWEKERWKIQFDGGD